MRKRRYAPRKPAAYHPDYRKYEALKAEYIRTHLRATPDEYQEAMKRFAMQAGI